MKIITQKSHNLLAYPHGICENGGCSKKQVFVIMHEIAKIMNNRKSCHLNYH